MKRCALILVLAICTLASQNAIAATSKAKSSASKSRRHATRSQTDMGFKRAGIAVGLVSPEELDATFGFGGFVDLGRMTPNIGLEARLDYWSKSESTFGYDASVRDITLGARGKYHLDVAHPVIRPFIGAGLGLHFLHGEVEVPAGPGPPSTLEDSSTKVGFDFGGGIMTHLTPTVDFHGEAWYGIVSDVNQFSVRLGMSYRLGS